MLEHLKESLNINQKATIFHLYIYEKMFLRLEPHSNLLDRKSASIILSRHTIPKIYHKNFLEEMQNYGLILIKDKQNIELINRTCERIKPIESIVKGLLISGKSQKDVCSELGMDKRFVSYYSLKK